jgi:hypothetical protein
MPARLVLILVLTVPAVPPLLAQDTFEPDARTRAVGTAIAAELRTLTAHPWAGRYIASHGLGGNVLELAPRAGFLLETASCLSSSWAHGSVTQANLRLLLTPEPGAISVEGAEQDPAAGLVLLPVEWGSRRYLLREHEIRFFCNAVDRHDDDLFHGYFLREGDVGRPPSGHPRTLEGALLCATSGAKGD